MVSLDDAVTARLESHGHRYEVLVDPDKAQQVREDPDNAKIERDDLVVDKIFKDAGAGDQISEEFLEETFGTTDVYEIANRIVRKGDIQLTTDQRRAMREKKRRAIVAYLARNAMDPKTGNPHPPERFENAMENVKFHVDPFKPTEEQVKELLDKLRPILPISIEQVKVHVRIPAEHTGAAYGIVRQTGTLLEEKWLSDGSWEGVVQLPAGLQTDFYDELNSRTQGNVETKLQR